MSAQCVPLHSELSSEQLAADALSLSVDMELLLRRLAVVVAVVALTAATAAEGYNITKILGDHPEYSQFNKLLTETRLAGDINRRRTITVLVVANGDMGALSGGHYTLPTLRHILEMHILVDYYGAKKLHQLARGDTASSSMFQVRVTCLFPFPILILAGLIFSYCSRSVCLATQLQLSTSLSSLMVFLFI